jgi:aquaporin Z
MLGHYDAAHNTIVVSRVFDRPDTPRCAIEYLLYHEMLHLKHPVRVKAGRRCVHSREFQAEERLFPELEAAKAIPKAPVISLHASIFHRQSDFTRNYLSTVLRFRYVKSVSHAWLRFFSAIATFRSHGPRLGSTKKNQKKEQVDTMHLSKRAAAEFFGTFWLVFGGCGSAVLAAASIADPWALQHRLRRRLPRLRPHRAHHGLRHRPRLGLPPQPRRLRRPRRRQALPCISELPAYIIAQVLGAIAASGVLYLIASGKPGFSLTGGFASNGYGDHSPDGYSLLACFLIEVVLTAFFLLVILGATDERAPKGFAPIAIGLCLTLIHLISIPVTNTSVNPARSTGPAIFVGGWALSQLWLFWVAPSSAQSSAASSPHLLRRTTGDRSAKRCPK